MLAASVQAQLASTFGTFEIHKRKNNVVARK